MLKQESCVLARAACLLNLCTVNERERETALHDRDSNREKPDRSRDRTTLTAIEDVIFACLRH